MKLMIMGTYNRGMAGKVTQSTEAVGAAFISQKDLEGRCERKKYKDEA